VRWVAGSGAVDGLPREARMWVDPPDLVGRTGHPSSMSGRAVNSTSMARKGCKVTRDSSFLLARRIKTFQPSRMRSCYPAVHAPPTSESFCRTREANNNYDNI
jgi:hypothetical protein